MITLEAWLQQEERTEIEKLTVIQSIMQLIDNNTSKCTKTLAPHNLILDDELSVIAKDLDDNLAYAAPEVIFDNKEVDRQAQLFSLGLLVYHICQGEDFYLKNDYRIIDIPRIRKNQKNGLICDIHVKDMSMGAAVVALTSWNPELREEGFVLLKKYINEHGEDTQSAQVAEMDVERWLYIFNYATRELHPLFAIGKEDVVHKIQIHNDKRMRYRFHGIDRNLKEQMAYAIEEFVLDVPGDEEHPKMNIRLDNKKDSRVIKVSVWDEDNTNKLMEQIFNLEG